MPNSWKHLAGKARFASRNVEPRLTIKMKFCTAVAIIFWCFTPDCNSQETLDCSASPASTESPVPYEQQQPSPPVAAAVEPSPSAYAQIVYPGKVTKPRCDAGTLCLPYVNCTATFFSTLPVDGICWWEAFEPYVCCPIKDGALTKVQSTEQCARWMRPLRRFSRSAPADINVPNNSYNVGTVEENYSTASDIYRTTDVNNGTPTIDRMVEENGNAISSGDVAQPTVSDSNGYRYGVDDSSNTTDLDFNNSNFTIASGNETAIYAINVSTPIGNLLTDLQNVPQFAVGGVSVERVDTWPFMAGIFEIINNGEMRVFLCGGSLISKDIILTAAHCFINSDNSVRYYSVRFGSLALEEDQSAQTFHAQQVLVHPHFQLPSLYNDIALVKLGGAEHMQYSPEFRPICLPDVEDRNNDYRNTRLIILGWGTSSYGGALNPSLQETEVPVVENKPCNTVYVRLPTFKNNFQHGFDETIICAGNTEEQKDACQGDSGGPLISVDDNFLPRIVGIVSSGFGCGTIGVPGIYTRVDRYMEWILDHLETPNHSSN